MGDFQRDLFVLFEVHFEVGDVNELSFLAEPATIFLHGCIDLGENAFIFDCRWDLIGLILNDFSENMSKNFTAPCFR